MLPTRATSLLRARLTARQQESIAGYLMSMPAVLPLCVFLLMPILAATCLVFTDYHMLAPPAWSGVANLRRLLGDARLWTSYRNTALISVGAVALDNILGFLLALAVNRKMPGILRYLLRTALFFPVITTSSSLALVWSFMLARNRGVLNWLIGQFGLASIGWLDSAQWAIRSVIMYGAWRTCGYNMVVYLAGLQGIPEVLYEAARIDGAGRVQLIRHITLPLITPTAFFCVVMSCINAFQIFDSVFVLTAGGPGDASRTVALYIYEQAFQRFDMGYATTISLSLLLVLVVLTLIQFRFGRRWVHYQ